jgi:hypothetical protein
MEILLVRHMHRLLLRIVRASNSARKKLAGFWVTR